MALFTPCDKTLEVTLLVLPESSMMTLASILDVMRAANRFSRRQIFQWQIVTLDGKPAELTCGLPVPAQATFNKQLKGDLLLIVGGFNHYHYVDHAKLTLLKSVIKHFHVVAGIEAGSWILARTGLLNGKKATTHWEDFEEFASQHPKVIVKPNRYVIDGNVITSGGASPSFDLMLHLVRERSGHHLALEVASAFIYDGVHSSEDSQPYVSLGILEHHEPRIAKAIRLMETHIDDTLQISDIAQQLSLSVRTLELIFAEVLKISPGQFYLRLRLQTAKRMVTDTRLKMQEIAIRTGFNSASAFSRQFSKFYHLSPAKLRAANQREPT